MLAGSADERGEGGRESVADQGAVDARVLDEVLADHVADGQDVAEVLHHGHDGDRDHDADAFHGELGQGELGHAYPGGLGHGGEVHDADDDGEDVAGDEGDEHGKVGGELEPELGQVDLHEDAHGEGEEGDAPAAVDADLLDDGRGEGAAGVLDGDRRQDESDQDDHGARDVRRQDLVDGVVGDELEDDGHHDVEEARDYDAAQRVGQALAFAHGQRGRG